MSNNHQPFQQISPVREGAEKRSKPSIKQKFNNLVKKIKRAVFCGIALIVVTSLALVFFRGSELLYVIVHPEEIQILQGLESETRKEMLESAKRLEKRLEQEKKEEIKKEFEKVSDKSLGLIEIVEAAETGNKNEKIQNSNIESQIREIAKENNFRWEDYLVRLAKCENTRLDPNAKNTEGNSPARSVDRGLWQINSYHHSEVSDECAFDVRCSTEWTMDRINNGYQHEWVCDSQARRKL